MARKKAKLGPSERMPNFMLPRADGKLVMFYDQAKGGPIVICSYISNQDGDVTRQLEAYAAIYPRIAELGGEIFIVNRQPPDANAAFAATQGYPFSFISDTDGALRGDLEPPHSDGVCSYMLDGTQRVVAVLNTTEGKPHAEEALPLLEDAVPGHTPRIITAQAPVLFVPNLFDAEFCARLIDRWHADGAEEGKVATVVGKEIAGIVDTDIKKRRDLDINDKQTTAEIVELFSRRLAPEIYKVFHFRISRFDVPMVGCYTADRQDFFRPHRDNTAPQTAHRRFAISVNLNDGYEGGLLRFPEYGPDLYAAPVGGALVYSCSLVHEAMPVTDGERFMFVTMAYGDEDEKIRQKILAAQPG